MCVERVCDVGPCGGREVVSDYPCGMEEGPSGCDEGYVEVLQADGALCPFEVEALSCGKQSDLPPVKGRLR